MANRKSAHHWSFTATQIMLQCSVDAYGACGSNKKGVHKVIAEKFNDAIETIPDIVPIDESKIRNKYDSLRRDWMKWDALMNKTGAGWDAYKGTVSGSDEWWEDRVKEFGSGVLKYKKRPLENLELMQQLFRGTNATGQSSYTPAATVQPSQTGTPPSTQTTFDRTWEFAGFFNPLDDTQNNHIPNLNSPSNPPLQQNPINPPNYEAPTQNPMNPPTQNPMNPPSQQTSRQHLRRRRGESDDKMAMLIDLMTERQMKKSRTHSDSPNTGTSVESTGSTTNYANTVARMQRLGATGEFDVADALLFVLDPKINDMFAALPDEIAKSWLIRGLADKRHEKEYQTYLINTNK